MHRAPRFGYFAFVGWTAWLMLGTGCTPAVTTPRPSASAAARDARDGAGPDAPHANVVSTVDDPNAVPVASAIRKVTVYSDRALVSRQGAVKLTAAPTVYAFRQLPGWVDEGSVRAATSAGRILDVRVVRGYLARATEPRFVKAEADARQLNQGVLARPAQQGRRSHRSEQRQPTRNRQRRRRHLRGGRRFHRPKIARHRQGSPRRSGRKRAAIA
jgi:hypothetical protein